MQWSKVPAIVRKKSLKFSETTNLATYFKCGKAKVLKFWIKQLYQFQELKILIFEMIVDIFPFWLKTLMEKS